MSYDWLYKIIHDQWIGIISLFLALSTFVWRIKHGKRWEKVEEDKRKIEEDKKQASEDKEWVEQLRLSLKHAFCSIALSSNEGDTPINDRESWNTAARHIARYWKMKKNLKTDIYKTLCDEHEEYWRNKFYLLRKKIRDKKFFAETSTLYMQRFHSERIDTKSAAIVYAFSQWKNGELDPIDDYSLDDIIVEYELFSFECRVFKQFVEEVNPNIANRVMERLNKRSPGDH